MSIIKQISVFDGSSWGINDIGANAGNIDLIAPSSTVTTNLVGSSNLFTALNNILPTNQLAASKVVVTDANKKLTTSSITSTQLGLLSGVTGSPIQTQINTLNSKVSFSIIEKSVSLNYSSSSNPVSEGNFSIKENNKKPIAIYGWEISGTSSSLCLTPRIRLGGSAGSEVCYYSVRVMTTGTYTHTLKVVILYQNT